MRTLRCVSYTQTGPVLCNVVSGSQAPSPQATRSLSLWASACLCVKRIAAQKPARGRHGRESRFRCLFSFPVFINKSARKKDAVVDRTNLSPKFPLPPAPNELSIRSRSLQGAASAHRSGSGSARRSTGSLDWYQFYPFSLIP